MNLTRLVSIAILFVLGAVQALAQCTYTSVAAGNWNTAATWTCLGGGCPNSCGVPGAASTIVVNHAVVQDVNLTLTGSLTINAGASLTPSGNRVMTFNGSTFTANGNFTVRDFNLGAGATYNGNATTTVTRNYETAATSITNVGAGATFSVATNTTNNGLLNINGTMSISGSFTNANNTHVHSTGILTVTGNMSNNGATFTNDGFVRVGGNLANNPGGVLTGNGGTWDVDKNAINSAGGFIGGTQSFCDESAFQTCITNNSCVTLACSTNCANIANPFNNAQSGTMDSTNISICGIRLQVPLSSDGLVLQGQRFADFATLSWQSSATPSLIVGYQLQRSVGGTGLFQPIQAIAPTALASYEDRALPQGDVYYRLLQLNADGSQTLSNTVVLLDGAPKVHLFPVPASQYVQVRATGLKGADVTLQVYNTMGQQMLEVVLPLAPGTQSIDFRLPLALANGSYYLRLLGDHGTVADRFTVQLH